MSSDNIKLGRYGATTYTEMFTVPASASGIADALREIAAAIENHDLCLIGLWSCGFGIDPGEATIQVTFDACGYPRET